MMSQGTKHARILRSGQTDAEAKLWQRLRNRQLDGAKFRRQVPVGRYVVDFLCEAQALVIELDGGQHALTKTSDNVRTEWLESRGYRVIRFWNNEVMQNPDGVLEQIRRFIGP